MFFFNVFMGLFFLTHVPILWFHLTMNLQDPTSCPKCSTHESLLGGTLEIQKSEALSVGAGINTAR